MNKAKDKSGLNKAQGPETAQVSESQGQGIQGAFTNTPTFRQHRLAFCVSAAIGMMASSAGYANPTGAQVVTGTVQFANPAPGQLNVTNTPGAIINWNQFSVGANETTRFIQQSAASAVLNRVTGPDISQILGNLQSNGRVFLINNNGVVFGQNSVVDTAGFVASTLNMSNDDFRAGKYQFTGGENSGDISNQGVIRAGEGGNVILIAPHIENGGVVEVTDGGSIVLAAGKSLTLTSWENPTVQFEVQAPSDSVVNLGKVLADGGAAKIFAGTVRHSGEIRADGVRVGSDGAIEIFAQSDIELSAGSVTQSNGVGDGGSIHVESSTGTTSVAGQVTANSSTDKGGQVELLGDYVQLASTGKVSANGETGGGTVLVGGDYQGNGTVKNASTLSFARGAVVSADALSRGDGGKVILWSDDSTEAFGHTSARGGALSGDGGFIEVSGKALLRYDASSDTSAANGALGTTLLDPLDTCVTSQANCADTGTNNVFNDLVDPGTVGTTVSLVSVSSLNNATSNVSIQAQNLDFEEAVNIAQEGAGLDAKATGSIRVGASITTNGGAISLTANDGTIGTPLGGTSIQVLGALASVNTSNPGAGDGAISLSNINTVNNVDIFSPINAGSANVQIDGSGLVQQLSGGIITANQLGLNIGSNQNVSFELGGNDVNSLNVTVQDAGTGGFFKFINTTGDLTVSNLSYAGADPSYFAIVTQGSDLLFASSATGAVNMTAGNFTAITTAGSILDGDADAATINPNIVLGSGSLSLRSQSRIGDQSGVGNGPLDTKVSKLAQLQSLNTGSDIRVRNVGALDLNGTGGFSSAGKTTLVSATDGGAASSITITNAFTSNLGTFKLKADDLIINSGVNVTGQTVRFVPFTTGKGFSLGSTRVGTDVHLEQAELAQFSGATNAKIGPGSNDSQTISDINITGGGASFGNANVFVDITGSVLFSQGLGNTGINTTGSVTATLSGGVTGSGNATDVMANSLAITAVTGIGGAGALNTAVNSLSVVNTGAADINIVNETAGSPLTITQAINSAQADRSIALLNQKGDLFLNGDVSVSGVNGFVSLTTGTSAADGGGIQQQTGTVTAAKLSTLTLSDVGAIVDFINNANAIGQFSARSRNRSNTAAASGVLHLENSGDVVIAGLETTGRADINVGGNLSQGTMVQDAILVGELNATTNNAAPKNITFDNPANDANVINLATLNGAALMPAPTGGTISFTDVDALAIGPSSAMGAQGGLFTDKDNGGTVSLTVGGSLSQDVNAALSADTLILNIQPTANVNLNNAANSVKNLAVNLGSMGTGGSFLFQNTEASTAAKLLYAGTDTNYTATINQTGSLLFDSGANGVDMAAGNFVASATGDILDNDSDATLREFNIKLDNGSLSLSAGGEIGQDPTAMGSNSALDTQVGTLVKATSGAAKDIRIRNIGLLTLQSLAAADLTSGGKFVLVSATDGGATSGIAINSVINSGGTVKAKADNLLVNAQVNMAGQVGRILPFSSGRNISIGDTESGGTGTTLHLTQTELSFFGAGGIAHAKFEPSSTDTQTIGDITFTSGVNFGNSAVTLGNTGNVVFAQGSAASGLTTSGTVTINTSGGAIQRNTSNAAAVDIVANTASLKASTGIGGSAANAALLTQVGSLAGAETTTSGDVVIHNSGALTTSGTLVSKGLFELVTASPLTIGSVLSAVGDVNLLAGAPDALTINAAVSSSTGDVNISADQLEIGVNGSVSAVATGKAINVSAQTANRFIDIGDGSSSAGNPLAALRIDSTEIGKLTAGDIRFGNTTAGNITFTGNADFGSANVTAQTGGEIVFNHSASTFGVKTTGNVLLDASTSTMFGRIIGDPNSTNLDIEANDLQMNARNGIGPTSAANNTNTLQTKVTSLSASTLNGDVRIDNTGALTINGVTAGDEVGITTDSSMTLAGSVQADNDVLLRASAPGVLTVNTGQNVTSNTSNVTLEASDLVLDGMLSSASGSVFLRPSDNTIAITVGGTGGFGISAAELSRINAGTGVEIGTNAHTGGIAVAGAIGGSTNPFTASKLTLSSDDIAITGSISLGTNILELLTTNGTGPTIAADISAGSIDAVGQTFNVTGASTLFASQLNTANLKLTTNAGDVNFNTLTSAQNIRIEGGRFILPAPISLISGQTFELIGGSVKTAGNVTAGNGVTINWADGTLDNTGTGNFIFNPGSTLNLSQTSGTKILDGRSITMQGNTTLSSTLNWISGDMEFRNGATVVNEADSIANITSNNRKFQGVGAAGSWTNQGTVNKTSTGTSQFDIAFNNLGTLNVNAGVFQLGSAPTVAASTFVIDPSATLRYSGGTHTFGTTGGATVGTASFSGGGLVELLGANWVLNENVDMNTPMSWTGGAISGPTPTVGSTQPPLQFAIKSSLTIDTGTAPVAGAPASISAPTANNLQFITQTGGSIALKGSDALFLNDSTLDIASGIVFDIQSDASVRAQTGAVGTINNSGTVRKSAGLVNASNGGSQIDVTFNNIGRVEGKQGELDISGSGTDTGVYDASNGAMVILGQDVDPNSTTTLPVITRTLQDGVRFTGTGITGITGSGVTIGSSATDSVEVAIGSTFALVNTNVGGSGILENKGKLLAFGNSSFSTGSITNTGSLTLGDFSLLPAADPAINNVSLTVGGLTNSGSVTLTNTDSNARNIALSTASGFDNSGSLIVNTGTGSGGRLLSGPITNKTGGSFDHQSGVLGLAGSLTLNSGSTTVFKGEGVELSNNAMIDISANTVLDVQSDLDFVEGTGGGTINNAGTFRKSVGAANSATTKVEVAFNNTGQVESQQGELSFAGSGTDTGSYDVSSGAFLFLGQELDPNATTQPPAITRDLNAGVTFTGAGTHVWQGRGVNVNTDLTIPTASNFVLAAATVGGSSTLTNNGTMSIFGDSTFTSGTIANSGTLKFGNFALLPDSTDPLRADASLQVATLSNTGTIDLANSDTVVRNLDLRISGTLTNSGTISATAGTGGGARGIQGSVINDTAGVIDASDIALTISGNTTGSITNRGNLKATLGNLTLRDFSSFTQVDGAAVNVATGRTFALIGNTPTAGNPPQSQFDWQGGDILGGGTWNNSNVNVSIAGTGTRVFNAITTAGDVNNPGNVAITGGSLEIAGGQITVINPLQVDAAANLIVSGGRAILNDDSTIANLRLDGGIVEGASGKTVDVTNALVWNGGQIGPATGTGATLNANAGVTLSGTSTKTLNGTTLNLAAGTSTYSGGELTLGNAAQLNIASGAIFDIQDSANIGGIGGGTITNAGTFRKSGGLGLAGALPNIANTSIVLTDFNNHGTVDLQQGALVFVGGGTDSGTYNAASGSLLGLTPAPSGLSPAIRTLQDGVQFTGAGVHELEGGQLTLSGTNTGVTVDSGATLLLFDTVISGAGKINNNGTLSVLGNSQFGDGSLVNNGQTGIGLFTALTVPTASIPAQSSLAVSTLDNQGTLGFAGTTNRLTVSGGLSNKAGGLIGGNGTIIGNVTNTAGTVSPGNSPGTLAIDGDYTQGADGTLILEINGTGAGEFDQLTISGTATLGGNLIIPPLPDTFVNTGGSVTLLTANTISGNFNNEDTPVTVALTLGANGLQAQEAVTNSVAAKATDDLLATQQQDDTAQQQSTKLAEVGSDDTDIGGSDDGAAAGDDGATGGDDGTGTATDDGGDASGDDSTATDTAGDTTGRADDGQGSSETGGSNDESGSSGDGSDDGGDQLTADDFESDEPDSGSADDSATGSDDSGDQGDDGASGDDAGKDSGKDAGDDAGDDTGGDEQQDGDKKDAGAKDDGKDAKSKSDDKSEDKDAKDGDKDKEDKDADKKKKKKKKAKKKADKKKKVKKKKRKVEACK